MTTLPLAEWPLLSNSQDQRPANQNGAHLQNLHSYNVTRLPPSFKPDLFTPTNWKRQQPEAILYSNESARHPMTLPPPRLEYDQGTAAALPFRAGTFPIHQSSFSTTNASTPMAYDGRPHAPSSFSSQQPMSSRMPPRLMLQQQQQQQQQYPTYLPNGPHIKETQPRFANGTSTFNPTPSINSPHPPDRTAQHGQQRGPPYKTHPELVLDIETPRPMYNNVAIEHPRINPYKSQQYNSSRIPSQPLIETSAMHTTVSPASTSLVLGSESQQKSALTSSTDDWSQYNASSYAPPISSTSKFREEAGLNASILSQSFKKIDGQGLEGSQEMEIPPGLDKYASVYTPTWLYSVNEDTEYNLFLLPETLAIDFSAYSASFLPPNLLFSDPDEDEMMREDERQGRVVENRESVEQAIPPLEPADPAWLGAEETESISEEELEPDGPSHDLDVVNQLDTANDIQDGNLSIGAVSQERAANASSVGSAPGQVDGSRLPLLNPDQVVAGEANNMFVPPLEIQTYSEHFQTLVQMEIAHRAEELSKQALHRVKLSVYQDRADRKGQGATLPAWSTDGLYSLDLPGVREDYPALAPGDLVQLRTLATNSDSWLKLAFEARVYVVRRVEGTVILRCNALAEQLKTYFTSIEHARFNVLFITSLRNSDESVQDVLRLGKLLKRNSRPANILKRWLFPSESDIGATSKKLLDGEEERSRFTSKEWFDDNLNSEQKGAALDISTRDHQIPYLIAGPPGTGKTKTLVEATLQLLKHTTTSVLLAAPSNAAADTLALRLASHLRPDEMVRLNDPTRTFAEIPENLLLFCHIEESSDRGASFGIPEWRRLMQMRVVVIATHDIPLLHRTRGASNIDLGRLEDALLPGLRPSKGRVDCQLHWTHLIIDEAGQATEADLASALLCVVPSPFTPTAVPTVVLCGDVAQLGPQIQSHAARSQGLDVSLLERLSERSAYNKELRRLRKAGRDALLAGEFGPGIDSRSRRKEGVEEEEGWRWRCAAHLVRNYRARDPALLHVVSMLFYDDALLPCGPVSNLPWRDWQLLPNRRVPLLFEHIEGQDEWVDEGASFYNTQEMERVVQIVESLTGKAISRKGAENATRIVRPSDIAIITPYREQVWRIRLALRKKNLGAVNVGNVEVYQGAEHLVTILSTVRTSPRFLKIDSQRSMGIMFERKRLCVSISRAKEMLIVVGHAEILKRDPYWRALMEHAIRMQSYRGAQVEGLAEVETGQISALEYAARSLLSADKEMNGDNVDDGSGETAMLAGRMAATALFEEE